MPKFDVLITLDGEPLQHVTVEADSDIEAQDYIFGRMEVFLTEKPS
jgi:hypothetical protein